MAIEISGPDGSSFSFPDGTPGDVISGAIQKHYGAAPEAKPSSASKMPAFISDIGPEIKGAFNEGFGSLKSGVGVGAKGPQDFLSDPFGVPRAALGALGMAASPITGAARSIIGHPMADVTQTIGEAVSPNAKNNPSNDQLYESWKGGVDKALGGLGARAPVAAPLPKTLTPSIAETKAASRAGYKAPEVAAVELHPNAVTGLARQIETDLLTEGFRPATNNASGTFAEVRNLRPPSGVTSVRVDDIDAARRALGKYAKQVDAVGQPTTEAAAAQRAIEHINDFLPNINRLSPADIIAGDPTKAAQVLRGARQDWASYKRASTVDTLEENAAKQAASTYGGGNVNNATRQAFRPLVKNNNAKLQGWSPQSVEQLNHVVSGGSAVSPGNVMRQIGRYAPSGPVGLGLHLAAGAATGGASIPFAMAAAVAKKLGIAATRANVEKLRTTLLQESNLFQQRLAASGHSTIPAYGAGARALPFTQPAVIANSLLSGLAQQ